MVEAGAQVGWPYGETEPHYFVARSYGPNQYKEFIWPEAGPGYYKWFGFYIDEPYGLTGNWCLTWDGIRERNAAIQVSQRQARN
jgi:hypothetical protein